MPMDWCPVTEPRTLRILGKLIEELNEAGTAAARCIIQGIDGMSPESGQINRRWLQDELADVIANIEIASAELKLDRDDMRMRTSLKKARLTEWLK
jgi:hypothetical protein